MSMLDEIDKLVQVAETSINYRIVNIGGKSLYVEGIKSVVSFGVEEMHFQLKKCLLKVEGQGLKVKYLDKSTCVLHGEIRKVETL